MADQLEKTDDDFIKELMEMEEDEGIVAEAEREAEAEDEKAAKASHTEYVTRSEYAAEKELEKLESTFAAHASDEEKELLAIYRTGDEAPKQLKRLMQLAHTKAAEAKKAPDPEEVEKKAAELAQNMIGTSPLSGGVGAETPEERQRTDLWGRVAESGDPQALVTLLAEDSEFISKVLNGQPLRK